MHSGLFVNLFSFNLVKVDVVVSHLKLSWNETKRASKYGRSLVRLLPLTKLREGLEKIVWKGNIGGGLSSNGSG